MIEDDAADQPTDSSLTPYTPAEAADYIQQMTAELAVLAGKVRLSRLAAALELACATAKEALAEAATAGERKVS